MEFYQTFRGKKGISKVYNRLEMKENFLIHFVKQE